MRVKRIMARALRPTALINGGFVVVTAAIVANAVFLQPGRHPAPLFESRQKQEPPAAARPDARLSAIQAALRDLGYYAGPVDGIAGDKTRQAIAAYEQKLGWAATGAPSRDLLAAAQAEAAARPAAPDVTTTASISPPPAPDKTVAAVQEALAKAAYGPLRADGVFGRQTREAIVRFQEDHGLPVTGEISDALIVELRAAGALDGE